jgi:hypothetical protein
MTCHRTPTAILAQPAGEHAQALRKQAEDARRHLEYLRNRPPEDATARAVGTLCGRIAAWEAGADALAEVERLRALLGGYRVPDRCHGCGEVRERGEPCGQCTCASVGVCGPGNSVPGCAAHGEPDGPLLVKP